MRAGPRARERQNLRQSKGETSSECCVPSAELRRWCACGGGVEYFFVMLTEEWGRTPYVPPRFVQLIGRAQVGQCPSMWMRNVDKELSSSQLFLCGEIGHGADWGNADASRLSGVK